VEAVVSAAFETVKAKAYPLDLAQIEQVKENQPIAADFGPIDILVNNAGMGYTGSLSKTPVGLAASDKSESYQCVSVQFRNFTDDAIAEEAQLSTLLLLPVNNPTGSFTVSKAGLIALSKPLAEERVHGIRVTVICPGAVNTELGTLKPCISTLTALLTPEIVAVDSAYRCVTRTGSR